MDECPFCNKRSLSWEDFGSFQGDCAGSRVCTSCGGVVEENYLTGDDGIRNSGQTRSDCYLQATAKERQQHNIRCGVPSVSKGRRAGLDLTKRIAHYMDCKPSMTAEAVDLFERLFAHPHFRSRRIVAKLAIAACSVYIVCRQHNWPVMLADVCGMVGGTIYAVDSWKRRIMTVFPDLADIRSPDLFALLDARCKMASVSSEVQQIAAAIVKLCRDLWLTEGRKQDNVVIPALFLAWQSEEPAGRLKVKFRAFCRDHQMPAVGCRATSCMGNMRQTLCRLANKIPWVTSSTVTDTNVAFYLTDIVKYRSTLIAEARSDILRIKSSVTAETKDDFDLEVTCKSSESSTDMLSVKAEKAVGTSSHDMRETAARDSSDDKISSDSAITPSESNKCSVKRQSEDYYESFWPPPGYTPCKKIVLDDKPPPVDHPDLDCAYLSSYDIPDEDMHLYLKSVE